MLDNEAPPEKPQHKIVHKYRRLKNLVRNTYCGVNYYDQAKDCVHFQWREVTCDDCLKIYEYGVVKRR